MDVRLEANRANWEDRTPIHLRSAFYDVEGWLRDRRGPPTEELDVLGEAAGLRLVHLQCHIGLGALSWARAGATVTGLDFSPSAIAAARDLARRAGLADRATFVTGDVHNAATILGRGSFDIVYVNTGSLCWLPSVDRWAEQAAALLRPGGRLYLHDDHPLAQALADDDLEFVASYFEEPEPLVRDSEATYTDGGGRVARTRSFQWNHSIGEIVTAVLAQGLRLELLVEHDWTDWRRFPWLLPRGQQRWTHPPGKPRIPLSFTLLACHLV
jgi:SAM-dependent methyltransferase